MPGRRRPSGGPARQRVREAVEDRLGVAELDDDIAALDQAQLAQPLEKHIHPRRSRSGRTWPQETDPEHTPCLLRARGERPGRRATEEGDELPTPHGLPQPGNRHSPAKRITSCAGCTGSVHSAGQPHVAAPGAEEGVLRESCRPSGFWAESTSACTCPRAEPFAYSRAEAAICVQAISARSVRPIDSHGPMTACPPSFT